METAISGYFVADQRPHGTLMTLKGKQLDQCSSCKKIFGYYELLDDGICAYCHKKQCVPSGHFVAEQRPFGTLMTWKEGSQKLDQCSSCKKIFGYYELLDDGICAYCHKKQSTPVVISLQNKDPAVHSRPGKQDKPARITSAPADKKPTSSCRMAIVPTATRKSVSQMVIAWQNKDHLAHS